MTELINGGRGGVVAGLGRPDLVTNGNGFEVFWYRCGKGVFTFHFDQQPSRLRTYSQYSSSSDEFNAAKKAAKP